MKKYLLSLLIVGISFISFSNASSLNLTCGNNSKCSPCDYTLNNGRYCCFNLSSKIDSITVAGSTSVVGISTNGSSRFQRNLPYTTVINDSVSDFCIVPRTQATYSVDFNVKPLLPGGQNVLSGVVNSLIITITEFGPYLIYIALGVLGCVIGFFAIKRLVNRIRAKILSMFK